MSSIVRIRSNNSILEMTLEKKNNQNESKFCSTSNINIIYEFFKKIKYDIKDIDVDKDSTNITLKNGVCLEISNDIDRSTLEVFKPLNEGINCFNDIVIRKKERRKNSFKVTLFCVMLFSVISGFKISKDKSADFSKAVKYISGLSTTDLEEDASNDNISEANDEISADISINNKLIEDEHIKLMNRMYAKNLEEVNYREYLPDFGMSCYDKKYTSVVENYGDTVKKYSDISGIDREILNCVLAQERGTHSTVPDGGGAIGIAQIQVNQHLGEKLTLYNVMTGEKETFTVTMELLQSVDGNIKVCVALLQSAWIEFEGNIFLMLQAYNYGEGAVDTVVVRYESTPEEINKNYKDLSFIVQIYEYSNNNGGYGDKYYLNNVFMRYPSDKLTVCYGVHPFDSSKKKVINIDNPYNISDDLLFMDQSDIEYNKKVMQIIKRMA